jgi:hypothetical protein
MHRIDAPGHVGNRFVDGNPGIGQQSTMVDAAFMNGIQETLAYVVEEANLALEKGDFTTLYAAIVAIATGAAGSGGGSVPTARQVLAAGLATGGGDLTLDRTITVPKASAAEVAAGVIDDKAVTPLALLGGQGARLLAGVGYATLFGVIIQWGTATMSANSSANVTLPIAFPSQCVWADFAGGRLDYAAQDNNPFVSNWSSSAITLFNGADAAVSGRFLAVGY